MIILYLAMSQPDLDVPRPTAYVNFVNCFFNPTTERSAVNSVLVDKCGMLLLFELILLMRSRMMGWWESLPEGFEISIEKDALYLKPIY